MVELDGRSLTLDQLMAIAHDGEKVGLTAAARTRVRAARAVVDEFAHHDEPTYGINTGFGNFAEVKIASNQLGTLQVNLLRSHAAGVGDPLPVPVVRATMALRANVLAKGFSGIRAETLDLLIELLNRGIHPRVPSRGSVGASGDLAPLAHLALVLIGEGEVMASGASGVGEATESGGAALRRAGLEPITLAPKEGLALINGTQPSTALLGLALSGAERLARAADIAAAMSIDGLQGSSKPFDARIHDARGFAGQSISARNLVSLLGGSEGLVNPALSGLPAFLTRHGGLHSGLMMAQVTAAALASELKTLAHPAGADTIPTSANKEDHVSMSMAAGLKARRALEIAPH